MPNKTLDERLGEFDSMFNWADQIKDAELERWKIMYGFVPEDIKAFIKETVEAVMSEKTETTTVKWIGKDEIYCLMGECKSCGEHVISGAVFCSECGRKIVDLPNNLSRKDE